MVSNRYFHFKNKHFFLSEDSYGYKIEQFINDAENFKLKQYRRRPNGFIILLRCWMEECRPLWPNGFIILLRCLMEECRPLWPNGFIILLRCWMEECRPSWPNGRHSSQMLDGRMPSFLARRMRLSSLSPIPRILPQMA